LFNKALRQFLPLRTPQKQTQNKPNSNPNKPNIKNAKMNVNSVKTKDYRNEPRLRPPAKQTQSNPISAQADRSNKYLFLTSKGFTEKKLMPKPLSLSSFMIDIFYRYRKACYHG